MRTTLVLDERLLEEVRAKNLLALEGSVDLAETVDDLIKRRRKDVPGR